MKKLGYKALLSYMPFQKKVNYKKDIKTIDTKYYNGLRYIDKGTDGMTSVLNHSKFTIKEDDHISNYVWNNMDKVIFLDNSFAVNLAWFLYYDCNNKVFDIRYSKSLPFLLANKDEMFDACIKESKFIPIIIFGPNTEFELISGRDNTNTESCIMAPYEVWLYATDYSKLDIFKDQNMVEKIRRQMLHNSASYDDTLIISFNISGGKETITIEDEFDIDYLSTVLTYDSIYDTVEAFKKNIVQYDLRFKELSNNRKDGSLDIMYKPRAKYIKNIDDICKGFPLMIRIIAKLADFRTNTMHLAILATMDSYMTFNPDDECDWEVTFEGDSEPYIKFYKPNDVKVYMSEHYLGIDGYEYPLDDRILFDYLYYPVERENIYETRSNNKLFKIDTNETLEEVKEEEVMDKRMTVACSMANETDFNNEIMKDFTDWVCKGGDFLKDNLNDVSSIDIVTVVSKIAAGGIDLNVQYLLDTIESEISLKPRSIDRESAYKEFMVWSLENRGVLLFNNLSLYFDDINADNLNKLLMWSIDIRINGAYNLKEFNRLIECDEFSKQGFKGLIYNGNIVECSDCYTSVVRGLNDSGTEVPYYITVFRSGNDVYFTFSTEEYLGNPILDTTDYKYKDCKYKLHISLLTNNPIDTYTKVVNTVFRLLVTNINSNIL